MVTVTRKVLISLAISVVFFAAFTVIAFAGLFALVETRFYNPAMTRTLSRETGQDAELTGEFIDELRGIFAATLAEAAVQRSFLPDQADEDIFERTRIYGLLQENLGGLQWVRFVDAGGRRLHFSTLSQDILRQDDRSLAYRSYQDLSGTIDFEAVQVPEGEPFKLTLDGGGTGWFFPSLFMIPWRCTGEPPCFPCRAGPWRNGLSGRAG